jgi:hypothetical protein
LQPLVLHTFLVAGSCDDSAIASLHTLSNGGTLLVAQLVEALRYKPEGRGFETRWRHRNFLLT